MLRWPDEDRRWTLDASLGTAAVRFTYSDAGLVTGFDLLGGQKSTHFERVAPQPALPRVEDVMKKNVFPEALEFSGTLSLGALQGPVEIIAATRGRLVSKVAIGNTRERTVLDEGKGWATDGQGTRTLQGLLLLQAQVAHPFVRFGERRQVYTSLTVERRDRLDDKDVWVVRAGAPGLPSATLFVAADTGLIMREDAWLTVNGVGTVPVVAKYDDYRQVGDAFLPFRVSSDNAVVGRRVLQYSSIRPIAIDTRTFEHESR